MIKKELRWWRAKFVSFDKWFAFSVVSSSQIRNVFIYITHVNWKQKVLWNSATEIKPFQNCIFIIKFQNKSAGFDKDKKNFKKKTGA